MNKVGKFKRFIRKWVSPVGFIKIIWKLIRLGILIGLCFMIIYPFLLKIINSFKTFQDFLDPSIQYIPKHFTWNNIISVMRQMNYQKSVVITALYSSLIGVIQVIVCSLAGYGFARFKFWGNKLVFALVIFGLLVPPQTLFLPMYIRFRFFYGGVNLIGSYLPGIILALTGLGIKNGLFIFMFRQFFKNMPKELEEAAYVDGCNSFQTYLRIMIPNAVTLMITVFLFSFAWQWTDTINTNLYMKGTQLLANTILFVDGGEMDVMKMVFNNTAAVLSVMPIAVIYFIGQKFFVQSVERSGITG